MNKHKSDNLYHHGIKGQEWGVRNGPPYPLKNNRVFISGSSKTQTKDSPYYRKRLPKQISKTIKSYIKNKDEIIVGDAPGIDTQVQQFLKKKKYDNVTVYSTGGKPRYIANSKWNTKIVSSGGFTPGTKEFNKQKDVAMTKDATSGLSVILENGGAGATRKNIERLINQNKNVKVYMLPNCLFY